MDSNTYSKVMYMFSKAAYPETDCKAQVAQGPRSYCNSLSGQKVNFGLNFSKFWGQYFSNLDKLSVTCHGFCITCHILRDIVTPQIFVFEGENFLKN